MIEISRRMKEALNCAIKVWEKRAEHPAEYDGILCPLCVQSRKETVSRGEDVCARCPVGMITGKMCQDTPFHQWQSAVGQLDVAKEAVGDAAKQEVAFLKRIKSNCKEVE